jgi:hypothetical protein
MIYQSKLSALFDRFMPNFFIPDWIPTGIDRYNKKIMTGITRDAVLFQIGN